MFEVDCLIGLQEKYSSLQPVVPILSPENCGPQLSPLQELVAQLPLMPEELEEMKRRESRTEGHNLRAHQQPLHHRSASSQASHARQREHSVDVGDVLHECKFLGMDDVLASVCDLPVLDTSRAVSFALDGEASGTFLYGSEAAEHLLSSPEGTVPAIVEGGVNPTSAQITPGQALFLAAAMTEQKLLGSHDEDIPPEFLSACVRESFLRRDDSSLFNYSCSILSPLSCVDEASSFRQRFRLSKGITDASRHDDGLPVDMLELKVCGTSYASTSFAESPIRMNSPVFSDDAAGSKCAFTHRESPAPSPRRPQSSEVTFVLSTRSQDAPAMVCRGFQDEVASVKDLMQMALKASEVDPIPTTMTEVAT